MPEPSGARGAGCEPRLAVPRCRSGARVVRDAASLSYAPTAPGVASSGLFGSSLPGLWNGGIHYRKASTEAQPGFCFFGAGCPTSTGQVCRQVLLAPATIGNVASATISGASPSPFGILAIGLSGTMSAFGPLPFDLTMLGAPGCQLRVRPDVMQLLPVNFSGAMTWAFGVPNSITLIGLPFYTQGLLLDPPANALGIVTSDANQLIVGR